VSSQIPKRSPLRAIVAAWFVVDGLVALAPPLYWAADGATPSILGLPLALAYFLAVATCIAASIIAAAWVDALEGQPA
jgi:hypothetical protein